MMPALEILRSEDGIILVGGEVDLATVGQFERALDGAAAAGTADVTMDLSATRFLGACGMGVLAVRAERLRAGGRQLVLVGASPWMRTTLGAVGLAALCAARHATHD